MSDSENALAKYVEKMYEIQYNQREKALTDAELKQIAFDMGITETEWQESEKAFEGHLETGKGLILEQNYVDAIDELCNAIALKPYNPKALYFAAQAHTERYEETGAPENEQQARVLINRLLQVKPVHKPALKLLSQLTKGKAEKGKTRRFIGMAIVVVLLLIGFFAFLSYNSARSEAIKQEENVNQAWAQVENVYQRRADLIPNLVAVVKESSEFEKEIISEITQMHKEIGQINLKGLTEKQLDEFQKEQQTLTLKLNQLFIRSEQYPSLRSSTAFSDLQTQIEGSENRISVERRKFNKAVQEYNTYIRQFPQNMMGFDAKPYFEVDKSAMENPKVSFD